MIIKGYSTMQFAGLKDLDIEFGHNLNVVLGPNEAGKSTMVNGIVSTLFNSIKVGDRSNQDKEFKKRFMPHPKGDYIDGKVIISNDQRDYTLQKEWGVSPSIKLILPDGTVMKDEQSIDQLVREFLVFGEETYKRIIFSKQEDLKDAIQLMTSHDETNVEVGDFLRKTVMELDGVSMDELEGRIESQLEEMYRRWDVEREYPENNRGVNNPYTKGIGLVLGGFYKKEELQLKLKDSRKREQDLEEAYNEFKELEGQLANIKSRKTTLEGMEPDIRKRTTFEPLINAEVVQITKLKEINRNWPLKKERLNGLTGEIEALIVKLKELDKEKELAGKVGERDRLLKRIGDIEDTEKELQILEKNMIEGVRVTPEDIVFLDDKNLQLKEGQILVGSVNLKSKFLKIPKEKGIFVGEGIQEPKEAFEGEEFSAKGILTIKSSDGLEIRVYAGELDMEKAAENIALLEKEIELKLENLGVGSIDEAKILRSNQDLDETRAENIRTRLQILLGEETKEYIQESLSQMKDLDNSRDLKEIVGDIDKLGEELLQKRIEKSNIEDSLKLWEENYTSEDELLDIIVDKRAELKIKSMELEKLSVLPEEFETPEEFFQALQVARSQMESINIQYFGAKEKYAESERNLPETSFEEIQTEFKAAQDDFNKLLKKGATLLRIRKAFVETKEKMDKNTDKPLIRSMSKYLRILTNDSYDIKELGDSMKITLEKAGSIKVPTELLSTGTKDSVALAMRLAIVENLLGDGKGMLVLDDCLVDMDPARKEQAVNMIKEFSQSHQVIFTTCSPETAQQLSGNIIQI